VSSWLMGQGSLKNQPWKPQKDQVCIRRISSAPLAFALTNDVGNTERLDLAQIVWEGERQEPWVGTIFKFNPRIPGKQWVEAEALMQDGRRLHAIHEFVAMPEPKPGLPVVTVKTAQAATGAESGRFVIHRQGAADSELDIQIVLRGNAMNGKDYHWLLPGQYQPKGGHLVFPRGATTQVLRVIPKGKAADWAGKSIILQIEPRTTYNIGDPGVAEHSLGSKP
ncbi:MAG TPA: hypothetical protein P5186_04550, partial [Candidatus Paceibacterota bacterium]|nr:hypothetical protein [Candidatus Paceibacterota bacterium]